LNQCFVVVGLCVLIVVVVVVVVVRGVWGELKFLWRPV